MFQSSDIEPMMQKIDPLPAFQADDIHKFSILESDEHTCSI